METTVSQQIEAAKDGRTQRWIVDKFKAAGFEMSDVKFTNKKKYGNFLPEELKFLNKLLKSKISQQEVSN